MVALSLQTEVKGSKPLHRCRQEHESLNSLTIKTGYEFYFYYVILGKSHCEVRKILKVESYSSYEKGSVPFQYLNSIQKKFKLKRTKILRIFMTSFHTKSASSLLRASGLSISWRTSWTLVFCSSICFTLKESTYFWLNHIYLHYLGAELARHQFVVIPHQKIW